MAGRMSSKVVLVTGGATGIGAAVARRAIAEGAAVVIAGRRRDVGQKAAADLSRDGGPAMFVAADVTVEAEVSALVGRGSIVNNASIGGVRGIPGLAAYAAAKHGVVGLTRSAALEGAAEGIRVNALVTGNVDTPLYRRLLGAPPDGELAGPAPNPTGRVAGPDEIASFVAFLLSDESAFITGAALAVDGGFTAQ